MTGSMLDRDLARASRLSDWAAPDRRSCARLAPRTMLGLTIDPSSKNRTEVPIVRFPDPTLIPVGGRGPEDVVVDAEGQLYTGLDDGRIIRVSGDGVRIHTFADTGGRPLGLELYGTDELLVCDADHGLLVVDLERGRARTLAMNAAGKPLLLCNNAAVARDGTVYFSDSSSRFPFSGWRSEMIEQTRTGRLLRLNVDGSIDEIAVGLEFANGVALPPDESYVAVAETSSCRVVRVWLTGERAGEADELIPDLPGYPDNISTGTDGLIWVALASPKVAALDTVRKLPGPLRALVRSLPHSLQPSPGRTVGVLGVDADGTIVHDYSGEIDNFHMLTGVREHHGRLYLGSLVENTIATTPMEV